MALLHIKEKTDQYIRFILSIEENEFFKEKYFDLSEWKDIEKVFTDLREDINKKVQHNIFPTNEIKTLANEVKYFLSKHLFFSSIKDKKKLKVIWNSNIFLPFELSGLNVLNIIYTKSLNISNKNKISLVYLDENENSMKEIYNISSLMKNKSYAVEYFSANNFSCYKVNITDSNLIHISTHGKIEEKKGKILIDSKWLDDLKLKINANLIFLNSCEVGCYPEGIIKNLLENGTKYLIVSPFFLFDNLSWKKKILSFYEKLNPFSIEESFFKLKKQNYIFEKFYRLFKTIQPPTDSEVNIPSITF